MPEPVRIDLKGLDRRLKLVFRHKDLRDAVNSSGKSIGELFNDPFGGWGVLLQHGLRTQDPRITADKASDIIDLWVEEHGEEKAPLDSLGQKLLDALNASGFVKIQGEKDDPADQKEGSGDPEASSHT